MKIVHRLITANREIVFESEYGNKIHCAIDPDRVDYDAHTYWAEVSPSIELKMVQRLHAKNDSYSVNVYLNQLKDWSDPSQKRDLNEIRRILSNSFRDSVLPWSPCREDWSHILEYLQEVLKDAPGCIDLDLLDQYQKEAAHARGPLMSQELLIDVSDAKVQRLMDLLQEGERFWCYRSDCDELPRFANQINWYLYGDRLVYDCFRKRKSVSRKMVDYLLSKVA